MRLVFAVFAVLLAGFAPVPQPRPLRFDYQKWADAATWPTWPAIAKTTVHVRGFDYRAEFHQRSSGCAVAAYAPGGPKPLWRTGLKGLGGIDHSKYFNAVHVVAIDGDALAVYGNESAGRYVEVVSLRTGKTVGHKVFPR